MDEAQSKNDEQKVAIEKKLNENSITESDLNKAGYYRSPVLDFLKTESGGKFGESIINLINTISQKYQTTHKWDTATKVGCVIAVVIATSVLSYLEKFEASMGVLFGTLVGFLFGKNTND